MIEIIAMDIQFRLIDSPSPLFERIDALNTSAFPEYERMDSRKLLKMSADSALELLAVMDGEEFVGFTVFFCPADLCYVFFLAIDPSLLPSWTPFGKDIPASSWSLTLSLWTKTATILSRGCAEGSSTCAAVSSPRTICSAIAA